MSRTWRWQRMIWFRREAMGISCTATGRTKRKSRHNWWWWGKGVQLKIEKLAIDRWSNVKHEVMGFEVIQTPPVSSLRFLIVFRNKCCGLTVHLTNNDRVGWNKMRYEKGSWSTEFPTAMAFKFPIWASNFMQAFGSVLDSEATTLWRNIWTTHGIHKQR
jgi:hypothetical protein